MDGSKMLKEIREQPEVLGRVLDEGWGEVSAAARIKRLRSGYQIPECRHA